MGLKQSENARGLRNKTFHVGQKCSACGVGFRRGFMRPAGVVAFFGHVLCGLERFTFNGAT
jgi:hypothetical protein